MSGEDVALARRFYDMWNEAGPQAASELWAEDFEFRDPPDLPDSRVVHGRQAAVEYLQNQIDVIGEMKVEIVDTKEVGENIIVRIKLAVHGSGSGLDVPGEMTQVLDVAGGRLRRLRAFFTWEEAVRAAETAD